MMTIKSKTYVGAAAEEKAYGENKKELDVINQSI